MTLGRGLLDLAGVFARDMGRYHRALRRSGKGHLSDPSGWISICNRNETLSRVEALPGVRCEWVWGSALHAPRVVPALGARLLQAALQEWPIKFANQPDVRSEQPKISFIFAHSGSGRLPQLRQTIRSVFAQEEVPCEVIVVDQSEGPELNMMPTPITYRHLSKECVPTGWHKSWAFNVGARLAKGMVLVFQDGDVCVPVRYARELVRIMEYHDFAAASVQRFLFYLSRADSHLLQQSDRFVAGMRPSMIFQNWKGGTIAIRKDAFTAIGGFDEGFVDWGGEDDEFFDRCAAVGHCRSGYLPFVHLWHEPQEKRASPENPNTTSILPGRLAIARERRIADLRSRHWGRVCHPDPLFRYG